jgi:hypothetical protein
MQFNLCFCDVDVNLLVEAYPNKLSSALLFTICFQLIFLIGSQMVSYCLLFILINAVARREILARHASSPNSVSFARGITPKTRLRTTAVVKPPLIIDIFLVIF